MVCPRCIETVENIFIGEGFAVLSIELGKATITPVPTENQLENIEKLLQKKGFELLTNRKSKIIGMVKSEVIRLVHFAENERLKTNLSDHLAQLIGADYSSLSQLFSTSEGLTIEKFYILQKIEKVKELLSYDELSASEIAFKTGYSSVAHLSAQFKKETGMTPGQFKKSKGNLRNPLDKVQ